jgi:lysozyme family protein
LRVGGDHPADRGGATNFGITAATLGDWRGLGRPASRDEVKALTEREARAIYTQRYLKDTGFDQIRNAKLRDLLLDCAVHHGPARATKWLQEAVGTTKDGAIGQKTIAATNAADPVRTIFKFNAERLVFYTHLSNWDANSRGWTRRVAGNLFYAQQDLM